MIRRTITHQGAPVEYELPAVGHNIELRLDGEPFGIVSFAAEAETPWHGTPYAYPTTRTAGSLDSLVRKMMESVESATVPPGDAPETHGGGD